MYKFEEKLKAYSAWILKNRLWVVLGTLVFVALAGLGMRELVFHTNYRIFFGDDNPQLMAFDDFQDTYSKSDSVLFVLQPKEGDVFNADTLKAVQEITDEGWKMPFSTRVDSLSNFQHTRAVKDDLYVADLVDGDPKIFSPEKLRDIKEIALNEPLMLRRLIAEDARTTGIAVTFQLADEAAHEVPQVVKRAREIAAQIREAHPDLTVVLSGTVILNNAFSEASIADMKTLIPMMYGIIIIAMLLFTRSLSGTLSTVFVIIFSIVTAMGLAGWIGIKLSSPAAMAPSIILTLAIADSIHFLVLMFREMKKGLSKEQAISESIRINFMPILVTSITTAIGFLSLNFSDAPPFGALGNITALGVFGAFLFSIVFLPALMSLFPLKAREKETVEEHFHIMGIFARWLVKHRKTSFALSTFVFVVLVSFVPKLELNDDTSKYFDHRVEYRRDLDFTMKNLTGIKMIEYSIPADGEGGISHPQYLAHLEDFVGWLRLQPEVVHVFSITDIFKKLNKNMHADMPDFYYVPRSKELAAQYLLLYEMSLPYGLDLNDRINIDKSASRLTLTLGDVDNKQLFAFLERTRAWMQETMPSYMHTEETGANVMFAHISSRNIQSMKMGNLFALLLISLTIAIALSSIKIGLLSIIPNVLPALMALGIWSLLVGHVNMAVAIISAVSLGIIVDDTVHFLSKYFRGRREKGLSAEDSVIYAFETVGMALVTTTFVLASGFAILAFSSFEVNKTMGILNAIAILCALFADFFLLGPLLILFENWRTKNEK
ncbi:MAG: efflux RND transporter permease subunit [Alphaproteobacteria bacterium]